MNTFKDRENAFENKYAHDAAMQFKASARCHKLLGLWAAEVLGKSADEAEAYARTVVIADLSEPGHEDVVRKLVADLGDKASEGKIRKKMRKYRATAKAQVFDEA
ncbi:MAG: DUF1476 domain-containing protein [Marinosulfonomonas sp.]|nr:DUF1476 domain-containing protein [Marinosulfonomonas sp.]